MNHRAERASVILWAFVFWGAIAWFLLGCTPLTAVDKAKLDAARDYRNACLERFSNDAQVRLMAWDSCDRWAHHIVGL